MMPREKIETDSLDSPQRRSFAERVELKRRYFLRFGDLDFRQPLLDEDQSLARWYTSDSFSELLVMHAMLSKQITLNAKGQ